MALWDQTMPAFAQQRTAHRSRRLGLSQLACLGRHTITGLACTAGRQDRDWSADCRFLSQDHWQAERLFDPVLAGLLALLPTEAPLVTGMDDTHLKKTGTHIPGVAYRRDPLSPPFHTNFVRAQRCLQIAGMLPAAPTIGPARAIPIAYRHVPSLPKPKRSASAEEWKAYRQQARQQNLSTAAVSALGQLRADLNARPDGARRLLVTGVDGSYTNHTVLCGLPERTILIGRLRKDAKLFSPPPPADQAPRGTRRQYGRPAPTPDELLRDESRPWQEVPAHAAGKTHTFRVKTIAPLLWPKAGANTPLRLVAIAPVGYRLRLGGKLLYRQPAYLICTDPDLPLDRLLQYYLWRWDIEVNHRDEKQLIGVGQAQVRAPQAVDRGPAFAVASYALLLLAAAQAYGVDATTTGLPLPKWRKVQAKRRLTTQDLIRQVRQELWGHALDTIGTYSDHFASALPDDTKCPELHASLASAVLYANTS
jgi:hypothetical protein